MTTPDKLDLLEIARSTGLREAMHGVSPIRARELLGAFLAAATTLRADAGEAACYGIRRRGTTEIIGSVPAKVHAIPARSSEYTEKYEEVPLYTAPAARDAGVPEGLLNELHMLAEQGETPEGGLVTFDMQIWAEKWIGLLAAAPPQPEGFDPASIGPWTAAAALMEAAKKPQPEGGKKVTVKDVCDALDRIPVSERREGGEPLSADFIQKVPDKCDRIIWRGHYYNLPTSPAGHISSLDDARRFDFMRANRRAERGLRMDELRQALYRLDGGAEEYSYPKQADDCATLRAYIEQQEARVAELEYRRDNADAFGEQCVADIDALLQRAESAEAKLAAAEDLLRKSRSKLSFYLPSDIELRIAIDAALSGAEGGGDA